MIMKCILKCFENDYHNSFSAAKAMKDVVSDHYHCGTRVSYPSALTSNGLHFPSAASIPGT